MNTVETGFDIRKNKKGEIINAMTGLTIEPLETGGSREDKQLQKWLKGVNNALAFENKRKTKRLKHAVGTLGYALGE